MEKTANEYLNADVRIGEIELTFFSTFPDFGLKVSDARVVPGFSGIRQVVPWLLIRWCMLRRR